MSIDFVKYARKGNEFLNSLAFRLGDPDNKERAGRVLNGVLHTLRDHITVEESMQLLAQLPMALKGVYVHGWKLRAQPARVHSLEGFIEEVVRNQGAESWKDYSSPEETVQAVRAVWETLAEYVSHDELEEVAGVLPGDIGGPLRDWLR
jgi:uncharacterized protein (DUF2267 family)